MANCIVPNESVKKSCIELLNASEASFVSDSELYNKTRVVLQICESSLSDSVSKLGDEKYISAVTGLLSGIDIDLNLDIIKQNDTVYNMLKREIKKAMYIVDMSNEGYSLDQSQIDNLKKKGYYVDIVNREGAYCVRCVSDNKFDRVIYTESYNSAKEFEQLMLRYYNNDYVGDLERYANKDNNSGYTQEINDIKAKAIANGTFMKAPNGKPTNLTEQQWLTVRTKAFKEWFGDWERVAKFKAATVIWGRPASGKTYLFNNGRKDIIDFDSEYKVRINKLMGLPEGADAKELRNAARKARKQEYHDLIMQLFDEAVAEAKRTGKKLLVSDMMLLNERQDDIDVITQMSDAKFIERSHLRGEHDEANKMLWKKDINEGMKNVRDKSKIIYTDNFLSKDLKDDDVSKVVDANGEPLVVYHGTLAEFNTFDFEKLGNLTGKGYYIDKNTGERVEIDSSFTFFFTNDYNSAKSYKNLAIWEDNKKKAVFYRNLYAVFTRKHYIFKKLDSDLKEEQKKFIDNVLSPIMGFNVRKTANEITTGTSTLTEEEMDKYADIFHNMAIKLDQLTDARSISNMSNNLEHDKQNLKFLLDNKKSIISGNPIEYFKDKIMYIDSGYGDRSKGDVYLMISLEKEGYYVSGLPGTEGQIKITDSNYEDIIKEFNRGIAKNESALIEEETKGKYNSKGHIMGVFLNIKNPLEHDYESSAFPDKYKNTDHETAYIAARQVKKALQNNNDGVIYKNVQDPFIMDSYGIFNSNQVKSATDNNGEFSKEDNNMYHSEPVQRGLGDIISGWVNYLQQLVNNDLQHKELTVSEFNKRHNINFGVAPDGTVTTRDLRINNISVYREPNKVIEYFDKKSKDKEIESIFFNLPESGKGAAGNLLEIAENAKVPNSYLIEMCTDILNKFAYERTIVEVRYTYGINSSMAVKMVNGKPEIFINPDNLRAELTLSANPSERFMELVAHELIHCLTVDILSVKAEDLKYLSTEAQQFYNEINKLYDSVKDKLPTSYGITNVYEFAAEAISNKEFQQSLAKIKYNNTKSLLDRIIDGIINALSRYLGINVKNSALEKVFQLTENLISSKDNMSFIHSLSKSDKMFNSQTINSTLLTSDTKINIYAGTNENADLSNFAERPFIHTWKYGKTTQFNSVEQAFQFAKARMADDKDTARQILNAKSGDEAKRLGEQVKGLDTAKWDADSSKLMKAFIRESFQQNNDALQRLLSTGNATLTHTQDKSKWGTEFPKLLMEVREELRPKTLDNTNQQSDNVIEYTPQGKQRQIYTIIGSHIYNKDGVEVFKEDSVDRNKIFANLAVSQKRAVVVEHKGHDYVVNNKGAIISTVSGKIMQWDENNGDRKAILAEAQKKFDVLNPQSLQSSVQNTGDDNSKDLQLVTVAPYFRMKLTSENLSGLSAATQLSKQRATKLAEELGLTITEVRTNGGIYQGSSEISYTYIIQSDDKEAVDLFAALMGDLSFEYQDAIIAANYVAKNKTNAIEITYTTPENTTIEDVNTLLQSVGIEGATYSFNNKELTIIAFSEEEFNNILTKLENNDEYKYKEHSFQDSRFLDNESRRNLYETWINSKRGQQNRKLYNACSKALSICEAVRGVEESKVLETAKQAAEKWDKEHLIPATTPTVSQDSLEDNTVQSGTQQENLSDTFTSESSFDLSDIEGPVTSSGSSMVQDNQEYKEIKSVNVNLEQAISAKHQELLPKVAHDAARVISNLYMKILRKTVENQNKLIQEEAERTNRSVASIKYEIRKNNDAIYNEWKRFGSIANEQRKQIKPIDNVDVIKLLGHKGILNMVSEAFDEIFRRAGSKYGFENIGGSIESIKKCWDVLVREAMSITRKEYGTSVNGNSVSEAESYDDEQASSEEKTNDATKSVDYTKATELSMSQEVRNIYDEIYITNSNGTVRVNSFGLKQTVDKSTIHAKVLNQLMHMHTPTDMIKKLWRMNGGEGKQILKKFGIESEQGFPQTKEQWRLFNAFYSNYRLYFMPHYVVVKNRNGKWITKGFNKLSGEVFVENDARNNISLGKFFVAKDKAIYTGDPNNSVNINNEQEFNKFISTLKTINGTLSDNININDIPNETFNIIKEGIKRIGINIKLDKQEFIELMISNSRSGTGIDSLRKLVSEVISIIGPIVKDYDKSKRSDAQFDIMNKYSRNYKEIAKILADTHQGEAETSTTQHTKNGSKTFNNFTKTCYLSEIIEHFKRPNGNTDYNKWIDDNYGQIDFFKEQRTGMWRSEWLKLLADPNSKAYQVIDHCDVVKCMDTEYTEWDKYDCQRVLWEMYHAFGNEKSMTPAWYKTSLLSDSPAGDFIKFYRYNTYSRDGQIITATDTILDKFEDVFMQEVSRIRTVRARMLRQLKEHDINAIDSYDVSIKEGKLTALGGMCFRFLPMLNTYKIDSSIFDEKLSSVMRQFDKKPFLEVLSYITNNDFQNKNGIDDGDVRKIFRAIYQQYLDKECKDRFEQLKKDSRYDFITHSTEDEQASFQKYKDYEYNTRFAKSQIIQLTTTDLAFYGKVTCEQVDGNEYDIIVDNVKYKITSDNTIDTFQKRYKEIHAPSTKGQTEISLNNDDPSQPNVGQVFERTLYLKDVKMPSIDAKEIENALKANPYLSEVDRQMILSAYIGASSINVADAQAYRSLSSYKKILWQMGKLTPEIEASINNIENGVFDIGDWNLVFQTLKPYVFTRNAVESHVKDANGNDIKLSVPVQHKNSEFVLMAMYSMANQVLSKNVALQALNEFMEKYNIDVVQFGSAVKVGGQGAIGVRNIHDRQGKPNTVAVIVHELENAAGGIENIINNTEIVHNISMADWGIQTATPQHIIDVEQLVGTQTRKLVFSDMPNDFKVTIGDKTMTKEQWMRYYNDVITENIIESFVEVSEIFTDPRKLSEYLISEIESSNKYDTDMIEACTWNEVEHRFNIPLNDRITTLRVQELMNSLLKNRVTKQKMRGGACIQVSCFGSQDLHVKYKKDGGIEYMECYMPMPSDAMLQKYLSKYLEKQDDGSLWFKDGVVPKELKSILEAIGYRVPTENTYSMAPLKVKGFLPQRNGSAIMLPADITTIAGSDFDVDKMYILMKEFLIQEYDMKAAKDAYASLYNDEDTNKLLASIFGDEVYDISWSEVNEGFRDWFNANKDRFKYDFPKFKEIKYDFDKPAYKQSRKSRNNGMLDLMRASITHPYHAAKFQNPGGYEPQKIQSRVQYIFDMTDAEQLCELTGKKTLEEAIEYVANLKDMNKLEAMKSKLDANMDPLSDNTFIELHQRAMVGLSMVGVFANYNILQPLLQQGNYTINSNQTFIFNGKQASKFGLITNKDIELGEPNVEGENISRLISGYLAAAVDNGKDPVLGYLNLNMTTADICGTLSLLGFNAEEVGAILTNPIVKTIYNYVANGTDFIDAVDMMLFDYKELFGKARSKYGEYDETHHKNIGVMDLYKAKYDIKSGGLSKASYEALIELIRIIGKVNDVSDRLSSILQVSRADTQGKAAGPHSIDNINMTNRLITVASKLAKINNGGAKISPIISTNDTLPIRDIKIRLKRQDETDSKYKTYIRNELMKNPELTFMQAFYTCGSNATEALMSQYLGEYNPQVRMLFSLFVNDNGTISESTANKIMNAVHSYAISSLKLFADDPVSDDGIHGMTATEKRKYFLMKFPQEFDKWKSSVEDDPTLKELTLMQRIVLHPANAYNPFPYLGYVNLGETTKEIRDNFKLDFDILNCSGEKGREMAIKLFMYGVYRTGLGFAQDGYMQFISTEFKMSIPGYANMLQSLIGANDNNSMDLCKDMYVDDRGMIQGNISLLKQILLNNPELCETGSFEQQGQYYISKNHGLIAFDSEGNAYQMVGMSNKKYFYIQLDYTLGYGGLYQEYQYTLNNDENIETIFTEHNVNVVESATMWGPLLDSIAESKKFGNAQSIPQTDSNVDSVGNREC